MKARREQGSDADCSAIVAPTAHRPETVADCSAIVASTAHRSKIVADCSAIVAPTARRSTIVADCSAIVASPPHRSTERSATILRLIACLLSLIAIGAADAQTRPQPSLDPRQLRDEAIAALKADDVDRADELVRAALRAAPDDPDTMFLMAIVLGKHHRFPEAIRMLDRLLEKEPTRRIAVLGQTADWMLMHGDWTGAEERFVALSELVPHEMLVHRRLANLYVRQGRREEAAQRLRTMCQNGNILELELRSLLMVSQPYADDAALDDLDPIGPLGRARAAISRQDLAAAAEVLLPHTGAPPSHALLGRVYALQQDFEALDQWNSGKPPPSNPTSDYWFAVGVKAAHDKNHADAAVHFCRAILRDPTDRLAYDMLGRSLAALNLDREAKAVSDRANLIARTQEIGAGMSANSQRDLNQITELIELLEKLQRPFESMAWRAIRLSYARSSMSQVELQAEIDQIVRDRKKRLESPEDRQARETFLLCDLDLDHLNDRVDKQDESGEDD